ncbi:MAG: class I SAM-dependent methyltransferase [Gemmatimonadota bacterium]|jgi:SAM-dependent methyltransferase
MEPDTTAYYDRLALDYAGLIRQLVPRYDELAAEIVGRLRAGAPERVLDVGCGPGELTAEVAAALPGAEVIAVEVVPVMAERARRRLAPFGRRVAVLLGDAAELVLAPPAGAAWSNLVLHNLGGAEKRRALRAVRAALHPGAPFLWGDLVRHPDPEREAVAVEYRRRFALEHGCPAGLVEWNFRKEGGRDHPLSAEGMEEAARAAGFDTAATVWTHDGFALVVAR